MSDVRRFMLIRYINKAECEPELFWNNQEGLEKLIARIMELSKSTTTTKFAVFTIGDCIGDFS
jgi:hypothetical protein